MKRTILAFVGASGCGKTMAVGMMQQVFGIPVLVSHTTRPMRDGEVDGVDHFFTSPQDYERIMGTFSTLAYTYFGGYHYWVAMDDLKGLGPICSYVVDEDGLMDLLRLERQTPEDLQIIPIRIHRQKNLLAEVIPAERMLRDEWRPDLPSSLYYAIIPNNRSINEFKTLLTHLVDGILKDLPLYSIEDENK